MAKKKGSGSNLGLIITLVFFVLSTVILGVTTYMGFSAQEEKDKNVAKMAQEKKVADDDAKYNRMITRVLRTYLGEAGGLDAAEVAREKQQFDAGQFDAAKNQKDKDDYAKLFKKLNDRSPWDASRGTAPTQTIEQILVRKDQEIEAAKAREKKALESASREKREKEDNEAAYAKNLDDLKTKMKQNEDRALADRKADIAANLKQRDTVAADGRSLADLRVKHDQLEKDHSRQTALNKKLTNELATAKRDLKTMTDDRDDRQVKLNALLEKTGIDSRTVDATVLDAKATQILRDWNKDWRLVDIDRKGTMPYINLGSSDGVVPQVTFSIHTVGLDGRLSPIAKGTLEVVRVVGSHLSQVRITSVKDPKKDPILKGDRLFNPTWDPNRRKRIAIAGLADLGDGTDSTDEFRRMLKRQNVEIDAFIDIKDNKAPRIEGKGISVNTDYVILGDALDTLNHPKARDPKGYKEAFDKLAREMKDRANTNGVTVIPMRKYLDMIGYRTPKVTTTAPAYGFR